MAASYMCRKLLFGKNRDLTSEKFWPYKSMGIGTKYQLLGQKNSAMPTFVAMAVICAASRGGVKARNPGEQRNQE